MTYLPLSGVGRWLVFAGTVVVAGCWADRPTDQWKLATQGIYHASLQADASHLVIGSIHHGGSYWTSQPPARRYDWNHRADTYSEILYTALSDRGDFALTADYHNLALWNTDTGESVWFWSAPARIEAVDLSADGQLALLGLSSNRALLFDVVNGGVLREFRHDGPVLSVSLSADGRLALTGSEDLTARLWQVSEDRLLQRWELTNQVTLVALSDDGDRALLAPAGTPAELWALPGRQLLHRLPTGDFRLYRARFHGVDQILLGTTHRHILQFNTSTGQRSGHWRIGSFWRTGDSSKTVLDMTWRNDRLWAVGSDGYLYSF